MPVRLYEREKVLRACISVFASNGYKNTSTGMLAEAAGTSKALIFHHFKSKKKLYFSLLDHCFEKLSSEIRADYILDNEDFFEAIDTISRLKLNYYRKYANEYKLVYEAFYLTPNELKEDIELKYGHAIAIRYQEWERLFEKVSLREGVQRRQAFELIKITLEHFQKKFIVELKDMNNIDEDRLDVLLDEMKFFCSMIRHGIAKDTTAWPNDS
ncbi:hypothetical protein PAALTS15_28411 [Paenibacillus alvei TS-15]|uniref:HTH tetR-type domain-containing protein n=1 Tax=Paenibacillus alvei TS-15 TaxID=1117108 RepID=S9SI17_PAEAL|nr:TetR/AcrR family transcriptional regulator [Paenibacillus alvei]EPY03748.1 hypothetical protein PAALTS15_28411 [Paenibacillus alvei TS-15]